MRFSVFGALAMFGLWANSFAVGSGGGHPTRARGEWIVTRLSRSSSWMSLRTKVGNLYEVKVLGAGRTALVRQLGRGVEKKPVVGEGYRVQPNFLYRAFESDPDLGKSWALENSGQSVPDGEAGIPGKDIGAVRAWEVFPGGADVIVAVLDSGIAADHPELKNRLWRNAGEVSGNGTDDDGNGFVDDVNGWNFVDGNAVIADENNHGSFCAGIIGAEAENGQGSRGVYAHVRLMTVKMLDKQGMGTTANALAAIDYAVKNRAAIINASWGGNSYDQALYDAVKNAGKAGVLFVAASGNDGKNNDTDAHPVYPASFRLPTLVSVAAYDNRDEMARFSNFGRETVHLGAPGVGIYGPIAGGYKFGDGTSYAAPYVTGVAAMVKGFFPTISLAGLRDRLLWTSEPIHYYEREKTLTGGRVHALNALQDRRPVRPTAPALWRSFARAEATEHPYPNNSNLSLRFQHPAATHVRVHFKGFQTESCCDHVILKDATGKIVTEYRGALGDFWSADALGDTLAVEFSSDFSTSDYGFAIDAYEVAF